MCLVTARRVEVQALCSDLLTKRELGGAPRSSCLPGKDGGSSSPHLASSLQWLQGGGCLVTAPTWPPVTPPGMGCSPCCWAMVQVLNPQGWGLGVVTAWGEWKSRLSVWFLPGWTFQLPAGPSPPSDGGPIVVWVMRVGFSHCRAVPSVCFLSWWAVPL